MPVRRSRRGGAAPGARSVAAPRCQPLRVREQGENLLVPELAAGAPGRTRARSRRPGRAGPSCSRRAGARLPHATPSPRPKVPAETARALSTGDGPRPRLRPAPGRPAAGVLGEVPGRAEPAGPGRSPPAASCWRSCGASSRTSTASQEVLVVPAATMTWPVASPRAPAYGGTSDTMVGSPIAAASTGLSTALL